MRLVGARSVVKHHHCEHCQAKASTPASEVVGREADATFAFNVTGGSDR